MRYDDSWGCCTNIPCPQQVGSTDGTLPVLKAYQQQHSGKVVPDFMKVPLSEQEQQLATLKSQLISALQPNPDTVQEVSKDATLMSGTYRAQKHKGTDMCVCVEAVAEGFCHPNRLNSCLSCCLSVFYVFQLRCSRHASVCAAAGDGVPVHMHVCVCGPYFSSWSSTSRGSLGFCSSAAASLGFCSSACAACCHHRL